MLWLYAIELPLLVIGLAVSRAWRWPVSVLAGALVVFTLTHTVYWSNMRMRTPVEPIIAVFVGVAVAWLVGCFAPSGPSGRCPREPIG